MLVSRKYISTESPIRFCIDIHRIINAIDVFVLPSLIEGTPMVILEAYSNGKPVIASNIAPIREVVRNEGILFDLYDINQLKNALTELYQNNILRMKMAENAKRKAKQYDVHTALEKMIKLYSDILKNSTVEKDPRTLRVQT